uniref:Uncharacterized protein n=1 Tax=Aureoumbra lagunensis TaxID=44058 RepID=A0A7S3K1E6_9STRA
MKTFLISSIILTTIMAFGGPGVGLDDCQSVESLTGWLVSANEGNSWIESLDPGLCMKVSSDDSTDSGQLDIEISRVVPQGISSVSFDWSYSSEDESPFFDPFLFSSSINGEVVVSDNNGANDQSGSFSSPVAPGETIGLIVRTTDDIFGSAEVNVTNFFFCP